MKVGYKILNSNNYANMETKEVHNYGIDLNK